jgi:hypothetical protein
MFTFAYIRTFSVLRVPFQHIVTCYCDLNKRSVHRTQQTHSSVAIEKTKVNE